MVKQRKVSAGAVDIPVSRRRSRKCQRKARLFRAQALRMLSQKQSEAEPGLCVMNSGEPGAAEAGGSGAVTPGGFVNGEASQEFLSSGRTGRRNAMPDILGEHADTGTADLPEKLEALTTDPSGSRSHAEPGPSQSQSQQQQQQQQHAG